MKRAINILKESEGVNTVSGLTAIFLSIASMHLGKTRAKVTSSTKFFNELWNIYTQLRIDPNQRINSEQSLDLRKRPGCLLITSESGLSGDIDQRIVSQVLREIDVQNTGLIVVGAHGANLLKQRGVNYDHYIPLPDADEGVDVSGILKVLGDYGHITLYYETYVSLSVQDVSKITLVRAVQSLLENSDSGETIDSRHYLFEPSVEEVIQFMESIMLGIAITQTILESKLAQYASRFNAMSVANETAKKLRTNYTLDYHRAKRGESDGRLKESVVALNNLMKDAQL